jgi:hypothetical protein
MYSTALAMLVLVALAPRTAKAQGQQGSGSPYSAYGFGGLVGSTQVSQALMSGASVAVYDPFSVIQLNPASYASLGRPVFEIGTAFRGQEYSTDFKLQRGHRTDMLGLSLGVPFGNGRWGLAFGLNPVSKVGYRISDLRPLGETGNTVRMEYTGNGGLDRAFLGFGHNFILDRDSLGNGNKLAFGANVNYLFGSVDELRKAYYPRVNGYVNTAVISTLTMRDPVFSIGGLYQGDVIPRKSRAVQGLRYTVAASVEIPATIGAKRSELAYSFVLGGLNVEFPVDTISVSLGQEGTVTLPPQVIVGFSLFNDKWAASAEYRIRDWSDLSVDVEGVDLRSDLGQNAAYIIGGSYRPAGETRGTFWTSTVYRAGFRYTDDYLVVEGRQLQEIGMSFGMSMPLLGATTRSRFNLGAELGRKGTTEDGLIQQRFAHLFIGLSLTPDLREQWFKKRRID